MDIIIPMKEHTTAKIAEQIVTNKKLWNMRIAEIAGKIINAEMRREPTKFIASTIIIAITIAINRLYIFTFIPVVIEKLSSKVTANSLL